MIEAKNIHKTYHDGKKSLEVLRGIDIKVDAGKFTVIVGPSGAGKSTLLHILGGLDTPTQGKVIFEDKDMYELSDNALSKIRNTRIGFVFQFYHLLSEFTVLENVLMPGLIHAQSRKNSAALHKEAVHFLSLAGLKNRLTHFPSQLSGGEKQRVAIVRGLINTPKVLFCDEPTGNLDSRTGDEIFALIRQIHRQNTMAVVMVTHNLELAKQADKVYHLKDGIFAH
ncbi:MAG: ABC transporter ATP-binding protein [Candidatus Omnitrophica bacterium]|nr:ABC transporter ATP-binding protein [Candidatus Omnitrophota bacterium]